MLLGDPFTEALVLDAQPSAPHESSLSRSNSLRSSIPAQATLAAFLAEMDQLDDLVLSSDESIASSTDAPFSFESFLSNVTPVASTDASRAIAVALEPARRTPRVLKRRIRPKEEIETLRITATKLQQQLDDMQTKIAPSRDPTSSEVVPAKLVRMSPPRLPEETEQERKNRELRQQLKLQLTFTDRLGQELTKCQKDTVSAAGMVDSTAQKSTELTSSDYIVFYEALAGKLDTIYTELKSVFDDVDLLSSPTPEFKDAQIVYDDDQVATLQFRDAKVVPFDFQYVCDTAWQLVRSEAVNSGQDSSELILQDNDVLLLKKPFMIQGEDDPDLEICVPVRAVAKRFMSKDRMVVCWDGTADWPRELVDSQRAQSVSMYERGWGVVAPMPGHPGMSSLHMCMLTKPGVSDARLLSRREDLAQLVIPSYQKMLDSRYQMIENMLFDKKPY
uniref:M96 mating-specific protein family n=1 Tax=Globisporangium ultimum (strain ATCC 200006 / CBS 805.95 / DAOM BR144) TaxID=431595 RepID=K3W9F8_GLOUD